MRRDGRTQAKAGLKAAPAPRAADRPADPAVLALARALARLHAREDHAAEAARAAKPTR